MKRGNLSNSQHIICRLTLEEQPQEERIPKAYIRNKPKDIEFVKFVVVNDAELTSYKKLWQKRNTETENE